MIVLHLYRVRIDALGCASQPESGTGVVFSTSVEWRRFPDMSFGFSVGDIAAAIVTVKDVYEAYKNSPKDYKDFSTVARQLCDVLEKARELCDNTHWSSADKARMNSYIQDLTDISKDLRTIVKKYESLASGSGRTRDRIRWPPQEVIILRQRITSINSLFNTFVSLVGYALLNSSRLRVLDKALNDYDE